MARAIVDHSEKDRLARIVECIDVVDREGRHHVPEPDLVKLAVDIYMCYRSVCMRVFGWYQKLTRKTAPHVYRAAELCKSLCLSPEAFVSHQLFSTVRVERPWLRLLASKRVESSASGIELRKHTQDIFEYKAQLRWFEEMSKIYDPKALITDHSNSLTPLMRYCLAVKLHVPDVAAQYRRMACLEYRSSTVARMLFCETPPCQDGEVSDEIF